MPLMLTEQRAYYNDSFKRDKGANEASEIINSSSAGLCGKRHV